MKITMSRNGYKISFSVDESITQITPEVILQVTKELNQILNNLCEQPSDIRKEPVKNTGKVVSLPKKQTESEPVERPLIRDRLPNTSVINPAELDVKQAVTEKALVRCPCCGQSHSIVVHDNSKLYLMRKNYTKDEFEMIAEYNANDDNFDKACCKETTDKNAYFEDLQHVPTIENKDFTVDNDTEIFCPVCCKSESFFSWKNAWINPLEYFETEHLCPACGGEVVVKPNKDKKKVIACEVCGYEKSAE